MALTEQQLIAIDLLVQGKRNIDIAAQLNITAMAVTKWKKQREFQMEFQIRRDELFDCVKNRATILLEKSIAILNDGMNSPHPEDRFKSVELAIKLSGLFSRKLNTLN